MLDNVTFLSQVCVLSVAWFFPYIEDEKESYEVHLYSADGADIMNGERFFKIKNSNDCHWLCGAGILNLNKNQTGQGNQKSIFFFMCVSWNYSLCRALDDDSRNNSNLFTYRKVSSSDVKIVSALLFVEQILWF